MLIKNSPVGDISSHIGDAPPKMGGGAGTKMPVGRKDRTIKSFIGSDGPMGD